MYMYNVHVLMRDVKEGISKQGQTNGDHCSTIHIHVHVHMYMYM